MTQAYPLQWPDGWARTPSHLRGWSRYKVGEEQAKQHLVHQIELLDRANRGRIVISTNVELRRDGLPYSNRRQPDDTGVAVYFTRNTKQHVIACDKYAKVKDNIRACGLAIEALRSLERTGAGTLIDRAFQGFAALPAGAQSWRTVLNLPSGEVSEDDIRSAHKRLAQEHHPDRGGDPNEMSKVNQARDIALKESTHPG